MNFMIQGVESVIIFTGVAGNGILNFPTASLLLITVENYKNSNKMQ
jgi:hypothetical protein